MVLLLTKPKSKQVINLFSEEIIMNFNKVKKMKNSDLGCQPSRTKKERKLSDLEEKEKKEELMASLVSRMVVSKIQDNWRLSIRPIGGNRPVKESTK